MKRENSKLISDVILEYIKEDHLEDGLLKVRIYDAWDLLLSTLISGGLSSSDIRKLTVSRYYKDGILTCRLSSSVIRSQLTFCAGELPDKLNQLLQGSFVDKVVLR